MQRWMNSQGGKWDSMDWMSKEYNGDGKDDIMKVWTHNGTMYSDVHLSTGSGFQMQRWANAQGGKWDSMDWMTGDYNGDGKDDMMKIWTHVAASSGGGGKPVVVDLDGDGVEIDELGTSTAKFDFDNDGYREKTAWVGKDDGLLVFDIGDDGKVTEAKEIAFAYLTENEHDTDLEALREVFDSNGDDVLNALDDDWSQFKIWNDSNQNGIVDDYEMMNLDEAGIAEIGLITRDGTASVLDDGTVNHGLIDVVHSDGTVSDGGDIAFAFVEDGEREVIDSSGQSSIEYEGGGPSEAPDVVSFTFSDQAGLVDHLQSMGFAEDALAALELAEQEGNHVVIKENGITRVTIEDTTVQDLIDALTNTSEQMIAYDGDMFEFDDEAEGDAPDGDNTAALAAQAVAESEQDAPSDTEKTLADATDAVVDPALEDAEQPTVTISEDGA